MRSNEQGHPPFQEQPDSRLLALDHRDRQSGQALIEYALIVVLVAFAFGFALAATGPALSNVFSNSIRDLLRQTEVGEIPGREAFWETVTYAAENPPRERPQQTNTPAPPTLPPTAGPSPTPSNTFTQTPITPTPLPTLTPTRVDFFHEAPWRDTVDDVEIINGRKEDHGEWFRDDPNLDLGEGNWAVDFYGNKDLSGQTIRQFTGVKTWPNINFTGVPFYDGGPSTNFSLRATRVVNLAEARTLRFSIVANDGVRVTLNGNAVALTRVNNPIDERPSWINQADTLFSGAAQANAGDNTIVVEYYQDTNTGTLRVNVTAGGPNPDDRAIGGGSSFQCNWGRPDIVNQQVLVNNANTENSYFEEFVGGDIPTKSRCYLELRGAVEIPAGWTSAELSFWDVWDFTGSGLRGWLEVAEYVPEIEDVTGNTKLDRNAVTWTAIPLRDGSSANYNWSHNIIDLGDHINFANLGPDRLVTFRFAIENDNNNSRRRWYIDDIEINNREPRIITADKTWTLDDLSNNYGAANSIYNEFIFTGGRSNDGVVSGWQLVGNNKFGPSGQSFHESVGAGDDTTGVAGAGQNGGDYTDYRRHLESPDTANRNDARAHTLEIDGYINLQSIPSPDSLGNPGPPILAFYHGYDVANGVGLEVQYTTDSYDKNPRDTVWTTFPDGRIRDLTSVGPGNGRTKRTAMQEHIISLNALPGNPQRIRIRWAMYVTAKANDRFDGWWVDQIRLGREEAPKWADYPFRDDAQRVALNHWRFIGQWGISTDTGRKNHDEPVNDTNYVRRSWSSNPGGSYSNGESTSMDLRYPIDLYNDTPAKLWADPNKTGPNNTYNQPAQNPVLTFYHSRDLANADHFLVQWRRLDETDAQWRTLWVYRHGMTTDNAVRNVRTAQQFAWEPVTIDLYPMMKEINANNNAANRRDDDIMIRFVLQADGSANATGIRLDDIRIQERAETVWKLWPSNESRTNPIGNANLGAGNGAFYASDADANSSRRGWWEEWAAGGYWFPANFERSSGALAFHDSGGLSLDVTQNQSLAPTGSLGTDFGDPRFYTPLDTFNVLQLNTVLDLRAVNGRDEEPTMYFWWRHDMGRNSRMLVQVSTRMSGTPDQIDSAMQLRCANEPIAQCYEQERGWTRWETVPNFPNIVPNNPGAVPSDSRWYAWTRAQVDLRPYAYDPNTNTAGKEIRVRFVLDNLDATATWDGWFIDSVTFEYRNPPEAFVEIGSDAFDDRTRNLNNWVAEGKWGLAPDVYQGGGGGPVNLGLWDVSWWQCTGCTSGGKSMPQGADEFLSDPGRPNPARSSKPPVSNIAPTDTISYSMGGGSPVPGWNVTDFFVGEFTLDTGVVGAGSFSPGNRSFLILSDDGIRMKVEELDANGNVIPNGTPWNVINAWRNRAPTSDSGSFNFAAGRRYRLTLQYFENNGGAVLIMSVGDGRYSATDSPKASSTSRDVPPVAYANSSLITKTVLDMSTVSPNQFVILEYQTLYKLVQGAFATVEVSNNGGFDWTRNGLQNAVVINGQEIVPASAFASTRWDNAVRTNTSDWQIRQNNLSNYRGQKILLRFRLDRQLVWCVRRNDSGENATAACRNEDTAQNPASNKFNSLFYDGWWITAIVIQAF